MRQLTIGIVFFLIIGLPAAHAQISKDSFLLRSVVGEKLVGFEVDNLGYLYLLDEGGQLKKLTPKGDSMAVFNDVRRFGKLFSIDVSNPLKVLLFYKDFGTIVVLDRFLNNRLTIDLRKQQIFQAKVIAQSFDNGVWVYDELEGKLKRLDEAGNLRDESVDFRVLTNEPPSPSYIADADRLVYLYDPLKGLTVLDYFGTIKTRVALLGWKDVQVLGNRVMGRKENMLESYVPGTLELKEELLPDAFKNALKIQVSMEFIYMLKEGRLSIYSL